jgi:hypothetical protein
MEIWDKERLDARLAELFIFPVTMQALTGKAVFYYCWPLNIIYINVDYVKDIDCACEVNAMGDIEAFIMEGCIFRQDSVIERNPRMMEKCGGRLAFNAMTFAARFAFDYVAGVDEDEESFQQVRVEMLKEYLKARQGVPRRKFAMENGGGKVLRFPRPLKKSEPEPEQNSMGSR